MSPALNSGFGVADCESSSYLRLDAEIRYCCSNYNDPVDRSGVAADPVGPARSDHSRVMDRQRSQDLDVVHALAHALLPVAAAAAFAAAM